MKVSAGLFFCFVLFCLFFFVCLFVCFFLKNMRDNLFQPSHPDSGGLQATFVVPWLVDASPCSVPSAPRGLLFLCVSVSVSKFILCMRTSVVLN